MSLSGKMNLRATIERATASASATGEVSLIWAEVAAGVRCALQPVGVNMDFTGPGIRRETTHTAYFEPDVDLRPTTHGGPGDRILVDGVAYTVVQVDDVAGRGRYLRAKVRREA